MLEYKLSRREFLEKSIVGSIGLAANGQADLFSQWKIGYLDAVYSKSKRQQWINQQTFGKKSKSVVEVLYATPQLLAELKTLGYVPPQGAWAATLPIDSSRRSEGIYPADNTLIGKGVKSLVLVFDTAFLNLYDQIPQLSSAIPRKEFYEDLELIMTNVILKNEFSDADNFSRGIEGYPLTSFKDSKGRTNYRLYNKIMDIVSNVEEFKGLLELPRFRNSRYLRHYANGLMRLTYIYYSNIKILGENMDKGFVDKLLRDFEPKKLMSSK